MLRTTLVASLLFLSSVIHAAPASVDIMAYSTRKPDGFFTVSEIFPVGWSRDGKFAYITKVSVGGRGGTLFTYFIVDTVTDKVVSEFEDDWSDSSDVSIEESIRKKMDIYSSQMHKYKILEGEGVRFFNFPIKDGGKTYEAKLEVVNKADEDPFLGSIQQVDVFVTLDGSISKRIYSKGDTRAYSYWIAGYFLSPFEKRALVIIGEEKRAFEGTHGDFIFSGCSLERGFRETL